MILPVQITFRNLASSPAVEAHIRAEAEKLGTYYDQLMSCRVMVEIPHRHHQRGFHYHLRLELGIPGGEIVVQREPSLHHAQQAGDEERNDKIAEAQADHKDIYVAIRDAFKAARRQLQDYARRQRGSTKAHEPALQTGQVARLFSAQGYGFLETPAGTEVYFHRNSVAQEAFDALLIGTPVHYVETIGEKGLQASYVKPFDSTMRSGVVPLRQTSG